jgi:hypothetical protein
MRYDVIVEGGTGLFPDGTVGVCSIGIKDGIVKKVVRAASIDTSGRKVRTGMKKNTKSSVNDTTSIYTDSPVDNNTPINTDVPVINARGKTVLPGFIDIHTHPDKSMTRSLFHNKSGTLAEAIDHFSRFFPRADQENIIV